MLPLSKQVMGFGLAMALGILMGVIFDFYRAGLRLWRPSRGITGAGDALFWLGITAIVFYGLFLGNQGEVRAYIILGLFLGFVVHVRYFSPPLLFINVRLFRFFRVFVKTLFRPFVWLKILFRRF